jgi:cyclic pyranopterin phosphate synthase
MSADEIIRIVKVAVGLGISKIKLTGGEPLLREDIIDIVRGIASVPGLADLSMTTNGTRLASLAKELNEAGLKRVNINLPTTDVEVYGKLTGGRVEDALRGVEAALEGGFCPVKVNMLVLKGVNDNSVLSMIDFVRKNGAVLQLIELERINITDSYYSTYHKSLGEYEDMLKQKALKVETRRSMQNRHIYYLPDSKVEIIGPTENAEFCMHCTRLRVTSHGRLKTCLMRNDNLIDLLTPMRKGASDQELAELFKLANQQRQPYNKS